MRHKPDNSLSGYNKAATNSGEPPICCSILVAEAGKHFTAMQWIKFFRGKITDCALLDDNQLLLSASISQNVFELCKDYGMKSGNYRILDSIAEINSSNRIDPDQYFCFLCSKYCSSIPKPAIH
jgi:hypothetical protein